MSSKKVVERTPIVAFVYNSTSIPATSGQNKEVAVHSQDKCL